MPPSIYESAMAEMVHNFKQLGEMMGPFLDRHPGLRAEFEAIRKDGLEAIDEMDKAAQRCGDVGGSIITFAATGQRLLRSNA